MIVAVIGAHGQIARRLTTLLATRDHRVLGLVRNEDQFDDIRADGGTPVLCDLEADGPDNLDDALRGADTIVFAAGAGPGSGPERKQTLDRDGAIAAVESAVRIGARHFVIVSSMGTDDPPDDDDTFSVYLRAKADADAAVREAEITHTILRPGALIDDEPSGLVQLATSVGRASVPRHDVAAVLAEFVDRRPATSATVELIAGDRPIAEAVDSFI